MTVGLFDAVKVIIEDDYDLCARFNKWLLDSHKTDNPVQQFRSGYGGRGKFDGVFPERERERLEEFFGVKSMTGEVWDVLGE